MFKKLKDKLAEEVKSSPQKFQQFAQAAQAAVTSASSSISDITNSDLFSIGDNDSQNSQQGRSIKLSPSDQKRTFQDTSLVQPGSLQTSTDSMDYASNQDMTESQRQRRLSNSSFASDVSFRLPSYESPSMYHLQSDMEISASEAEERGFSSGNVSLDRVTKEQIYAAYRRTQERYTKYRTQYADLARHYKLLERENAKAKSVLVETQDKALRRISELREQCSLEQSAKAHLEKALRVEMEEKNLKIDTLNTKIKLLQDHVPDQEIIEKNVSEEENNLHLISFDNENNFLIGDPSSSESVALNNKIEKLEKLLTKYKESLKTTKEKNAQLTTEIQILSSELETKNKDIEQLKVNTQQLEETKQKIQELNDLNEELQNKVNAFDFNKTKEITTLELDLQKSQEEIAQLRSKIEVFTKREEEYAISLAENKLSIHKELESKEAEIKSLKDRLAKNKQEVQSLNIVINDYKNNISSLEDECSKLKKDVYEFDITKSKIVELESQVQALTQKCQALESSKTKADEDYKCLMLQLKQETAEKLAMIDRNVYLEHRNTQLSEENIKRSSQVSTLENELQALKKEKESVIEGDSSEKIKMTDEINLWKNKYSELESEMQEERDELVKLQSEIEKLLTNHELIQIQNSELNLQLTEMKSKNKILTEQQSKSLHTMKTVFNDLVLQVKELQETIWLTSQDIKTLKTKGNDEMKKYKDNIIALLLNLPKPDELNALQVTNEEHKKQYSDSQLELKQMSEKYQDLAHKLGSMEEENNKLKIEINNYDIEKRDTDEKLRYVSEQYTKTSNDLMSIKKDKHELTDSLIEVQTKCQQLQKSIVSANDEKVILKQEIATMVESLSYLENNNKIKNTQIKELRQEQEDNINKLNQLKQANDTLIIKLKEAEGSQIRAEQLQQIVKELTEENISLKTQSEGIAKNIKDLEIELREVRKSHAEIDIEKDHLASIIEKLEKNEREKQYFHQNIQTDEYIKEINADINVKDSDETFEKVHLSELQQGNDSAAQTTTITNDNTEEYNSIIYENSLLKEENKRLQSDVVGLQTYLAKISKENSDLNDNLRELIATGESLPSKGESLNHDLTYLRTEIQSEKDRLDELIRENTLLVEENLELKDQLNSHSYVKPSELPKDNTNEIDYAGLKEKYKNLMEINSRLEKRMMDLESMNNSVNGNVLQLQENNDKLKLTNEKLERRLDEALVSLRHLHSLQENTELEYLRNILYEYLTGTGAHSVTLAKVLAAVVKFDDRQTQLILQKEKERQGLLRQLGII